VRNTKIITIEQGNNVGKTILHNLPKGAKEVSMTITYNKSNRVVTATVNYELK